MRSGIAVCFLTVSSLSGAASFSLEQILSPAFPSDLTVSATGNRLAWVSNAQGVRNIWASTNMAQRYRSVTAYTEDDGQQISDLQWTPDESQIVYVRGGAGNNRGELPNPAHQPEGVEQAIWIVGLTPGSSPRKIAAGAAYALSPSGSIAWVRAGQVWSAPLDGSRKEAQLFKARGSASSLTWSPDGKRLAFISNRGDHAFLGLYDLETKSLRFLDPSLDRDRDPIWSPDGRSLAFLRIPAVKFPMPFTPEREAQPWSIRLVDAASGTGRELWKASPGPGSAFHEIVADRQILWLNGRVVFPWEKTGWTHLYAIPVSGGAPTALTQGEFEVEHVWAKPGGDEILYSSNEGDIDRRHIWQVSAAGGRAEAVPRREGIEWSACRLQNGAIAMLRSDAHRPAHVAIQQVGSILEPNPESIPTDFPVQSLVQPQPVIITAADGIRTHAQLFLPAGAKPGDRRPAVIFLHGGSRRQMLLGWNYSSYYHNAYALNQYLASRGFVVLSLNYRSGIGYGLEFREALNYGAAGASEFLDVKAAGQYLRDRPDVDPARIGLWGGSYGGFLTALGLSRAPELFAAGVDIHGVHDWNVVIRNFAPNYEAEHRAEAKLAFESSPMSSLEKWKAPVLLIHGDDDRNVPFSESVTLAEQLRKQGVPFEQLVLPDEVHSFLRHQSWLTVYKATAAFLEKHLAPDQGNAAAHARQ